MYNYDLRQGVSEVIDNFVANNRMFTAYDVTMEARKLNYFAKHDEANAIVKEMFSETKFGNNYERSIITLENDTQPYVYHPENSNPLNYPSSKIKPSLNSQNAVCDSQDDDIDTDAWASLMRNLGCSFTPTPANCCDNNSCCTPPKAVKITKGNDSSDNVKITYNDPTNMHFIAPNPNSTPAPTSSNFVAKKSDKRNTLAIPSFFLKLKGYKIGDKVYVYKQNGKVIVSRKQPKKAKNWTCYHVNDWNQLRITQSTLAKCGHAGSNYKIYNPKGSSDRTKIMVEVDA